MMNLRGLDAVETCYPFGQYHHVVFRKEPRDLEQAKSIVSATGAEDLEVKQIDATIEDCFMELMQR